MTSLHLASSRPGRRLTRSARSPIAATVTCLAALFALSGLTACSGEASEPTETTSEPTAQYQDLWGVAGDNLVLPGGQDYETSSDANQAVGLGEDTAIQFTGYYFPRETYGYWCATTPDGLWISRVVENKTQTILMGEGQECATTPDDATVVGDERRSIWTKGADEMGGEEMAPWGTRPIVEPKPDAVLLNEVAEVAENLMLHFASNGEAADQATAADLVADVGLQDSTRVIGYTVNGDPAEADFSFCVVDDERRDWARYESMVGGVAASGADADDLEQACAS